MAASVHRRPAIPVSSTTDMLVMATLINPRTPTLRLSANSDHSRGTPRNARVMSERDERRYVISTRLPAPNDRVRPQPAPAGPNAGTGPQPKISRGERRMCASTLLPITAEGRVMLPVPRTAPPSRFSMQIDIAPLNATFAQESAAERDELIMDQATHNKIVSFIWGIADERPQEH